MLGSRIISLAASAAVAFAQTYSGGFDGDWDAAYSQAESDVSRLSLSDKIGIVTGVGWSQGPCVGNTHAANSIGFPSLCLQDGPLGVRYATGITAFPAGVQAASTWDKKLIYDRGHAIGEEAKALGIHVMLGPVAGGIGKFAAGGRNWEGFSPDPYLTGIAMIESIAGMQDAGVQATGKHYIGNEQENRRDTISSNIDDKTMHELYLWPFADSVWANVAAMMCSYNKLDDTWTCEDEHAMDELLKEELGFKGYIMTDWNAQHSTVESANAGLDMTMPGTDFNGDSIYWGNQLQSAVQQGQVSEDRVDDMVTRIIASWYLTGQDQSYPPVAFDSWNGNGGPDVSGNHDEVALAVARDGIVLLKNEDNILPLSNPGSIAIIGSDAIANPQGINSCADMGCNQGTLTMGWGSGTVNMQYLIAPNDAITERAQQSGGSATTSGNDDANQGRSAAQGADLAIVFINADSGEGYIEVEGNFGDRNDLYAWHNGDDLVRAVAEANDNTIVVIHSTGAILMEDWIDMAGVKAVVWAGLPGQESGNSLVEVLWGDVAPSGKMPYTLAKTAEDYGTSIVTAGPDNFEEGVFIDYRHFDESNIEPRFEFGFGLSYTTFNYSEISVEGAPSAGPATGPTVPGGAADLYETVSTVSLTVTNSGDVAGAEVPQLYVGYPSSASGQPPRQLRGFDKVMIEPGESADVTFEIRRKDLSYWDTDAKQWVVPEGTFTLDVGSSSRDLRSSGEITV
ncbi:putative glycosyl hydrolase [Lineolata rhizophorae]|uniref:beta-glucosidase n=1 Tax=Lineolata rhizophorae TaxID=578093 RepID=A0A6A6NXH5_9PEZI|nr:putative glycosyl hydrolase [Lineolata rhizophorae]